MVPLSPWLPPAVKSGTDAPGPFGGYATPAELDTLENFIFSLAPVTLAKFITDNGGVSKVAVVVFSSEYRPAADTVDGRHADLTFSRTGIARVGTARLRYLPESRGFWPEDEDNAHNFRVILWMARRSPARAAARCSFGPDLGCREMPLP